MPLLGANVLTNSSAKQGLAGWESQGVTVVNEGLGGEACFKLSPGGYMKQTISSLSFYTEGFRVFFDFKGDYPASLKVLSHIKVTAHREGGLKNIYFFPFNIGEHPVSCSLGNGWKRLYFDIQTGLGVTSLEVRVINASLEEYLTAGHWASPGLDYIPMQLGVLYAYNICIQPWEMTYEDYEPPPIFPPDEEPPEPPPAPEVDVGEILTVETIKLYPNKCFNSGFEVLDASTQAPKYWNTNGEATEDSCFEGNRSLLLKSGQYAEQREEGGRGLADPAWWGWCDNGTRVSFRCKGWGTVRVKVLQNGSPVPLWYWVDNAGKKEKSNPSSSLEFQAGMDWHEGFFTFGALTNPYGGKIKLRFENAGSGDIYLDAVAIEPDITGERPSFYTPGIDSSAEGNVGVEYKRLPYSRTTQIYFSRWYGRPPVVTAGIEYEGSSVSEIIMTPHIKLLQQYADGVNWYVGAEITWAGGPGSIAGAYTTLIAICR